MNDLVKIDNPKITSLERLAALADQKRAVRFYGIVKPAAVVLHMQGAQIAEMIRSDSLFEYVKPDKPQRTMKFYRSEKSKRPLYAELEEQLKKSKEMIQELIEAYETFADPDEVTALIKRAEDLIQERK